ncbi:MAG: glycosyltransferase [Planctomycetota bacterium]
MDVSVVIPVFNEAPNLAVLHDRLRAVLDQLDRDYELIYVNDGSTDGSATLLEGFVATGQTIVVDLARNCGQHAAIFAGFEASTGEIVITIDADLQNPPEEIPKLLAATDAGHDVVGGVRIKRHDAWHRRALSRLANRVLRALTGTPMNDIGCMLRAYHRSVVQRMCASGSSTAFVPALAMSFAACPGEIEVEHAERVLGSSKYTLWRLCKLQLDLLTSSSIVPLRLCFFAGAALVVVGGVLLTTAVMRATLGEHPFDGTLALFAVIFVALGGNFIGVGLLGEYVGRIYGEVRRRPRYFVRRVLGRETTERRAVSPRFSSRLMERPGRLPSAHKLD